jgi:hypothetical protein
MVKYAFYDRVSLLIGYDDLDLVMDRVRVIELDLFSQPLDLIYGHAFDPNVFESLHDAFKARCSYDRRDQLIINLLSSGLHRAVPHASLIILPLIIANIIFASSMPYFSKCYQTVCSSFFPEWSL